MKDFKDFKDSISNEKLNQILNTRIEKLNEMEKKHTFEDPIEGLLWRQRSEAFGFIFDLLEEYHKWLNE